MKSNLSRASLWLRVLSLLLGAIVLFWLPVEDTNLRGPIVLGAIGAALAGLHLYHRLQQVRTPVPVFHTIVLGGLAGLAAGPLAVALMVFKSGLHGHGFPDFSTAELWRVLSNAPRWGLVGLLGGGALAGGLAVRRKRTGETPANHR